MLERRSHTQKACSMHFDRRQLLQYSSTAALLGASTLACHSIPSAPPRPKLRILILGGTGFLGPALVEAARPHGHELTLFNRGKTNPGLFPDIEKLNEATVKSIAKMMLDNNVFTSIIIVKGTTQVGRRVSFVRSTFVACRNLRS